MYAVMPQMCRDISTALQDGYGVIVDHVITSERIFQTVQNATEERLYIVKVCADQAVLQARERQRGDRYAGSAVASLAYLYPAEGYDLTVDTGRLSAREAASTICENWQSKSCRREELVFQSMPTDAPAVITLIEELNACLTKIVGDNGTKHVNLTDFSKERCVFIVGFLEGEPVCCAGIRMIDAECGEIKRVYARPNRKGVGTRLLRELERWARANGYTSLKLECREANRHAIAFYRRNGYDICEKYEPYLDMPDAVCMTKTLDGNGADGYSV